LVCSGEAELVKYVREIKKQLGIVFFPKELLDANLALLTEKDFADAVMQLVKNDFGERIVDLYSSDRISFRDALTQAGVRVWFFPKRAFDVMSVFLQRFFPSLHFVQTNREQEQKEAGAVLLGRAFDSAKIVLVTLLRKPQKQAGFSENFR
ncbi:MAG: hypothetical protein ACRCYO_08040, partial [Bacteroidia bacterium]